MSCSTCDDLRRQLREAREEVEAWEADAKSVALNDAALERLGRWKSRLKLRPASVLILMALADAPGRTLSRPTLLRVARGSPSGNVKGDPEGNVVGVAIYHARKALADARVDVKLHLDWGCGFRLTVEDAARLRAVMGEAA